MSSILPISFDQKNEKPKPEAHNPLLYEKAARKILSKSNPGKSSSSQQVNLIYAWP